MEGLKQQFGAFWGPFEDYLQRSHVSLGEVDPETDWDLMLFEVPWPAGRVPNVIQRSALKKAIKTYFESSGNVYSRGGSSANRTPQDPDSLLALMDRSDGPTPIADYSSAAKSTKSTDTRLSCPAKMHTPLSGSYARNLSSLRAEERPKKASAAASGPTPGYKSQRPHSAGPSGERRAHHAVKEGDLLDECLEEYSSYKSVGQQDFRGLYPTKYNKSVPHVPLDGGAAAPPQKAAPVQAFAAVPETDRHPVKMAAGSSGGAGAYKSAPPQPSDDDLNSLVDSILSGPHEAAAPTREPRQIPTGYVPSTAQETDAAKIWQSGDADLADLADSLLAETGGPARQKAVRPKAAPPLTAWDPEDDAVELEPRRVYRNKPIQLNSETCPKILDDVESEIEALMADEYKHLKSQINPIRADHVQKVSRSFCTAAATTTVQKSLKAGKMKSAPPGGGSRALAPMADRPEPLQPNFKMRALPAPKTHRPTLQQRDNELHEFCGIESGTVCDKWLSDWKRRGAPDRSAALQNAREDALQKLEAHRQGRTVVDSWAMPQMIRTYGEANSELLRNMIADETTAKVDRDGNEELNVQEFRSLYEQTHPGLTLTDAQIRDAFEWSDKDADGNLSFAEVMLWLDKEATEETGRVVPVKCARPQSRRPPKALAPAAARPASAQSHGGAGADAAASWGSAPGPGSLADSHTPWLTMLATCGGDGLD